MDAPTFHPDLPWSVDALLLRAVHTKLAGDVALVSYLTGGIHRIEHPDLWVKGTWVAPALTVDIETSLEVVVTNGGASRLETTLRVGLYTLVVETDPETESIRSRVLDRAKGLLRSADDGDCIYHDPDGRPLNLPLLKFLTDARAGRLKSRPNTLYNELRFTLMSDVKDRMRTWQ